MGKFATKKNKKQSVRKMEIQKSMKLMKKSVKNKQTGKDKSGAMSVSAQFKISLAALMFKMEMCEPHFVRCVKPNSKKQPHQWESALVLRQLTYTGMLQTVKMRREGYPFRIPFAEFYGSFYGLVFPFNNPQKGNAQNCKELLTKLEEKIDAERAESGITSLTSSLRGWKVAKSMVFLKYWQLDLLEGRAYPFQVAALTIQTNYRGHMARKRLVPLKAKYRDECAVAATMLAGISRQAETIFSNLENIAEEEVRRGPVSLGIEKPVDKKAEKKAEKEAVAAKPVDQKKFAKELDKVKKGVVKWWLKFERAKAHHIDETGKVWPWFHGLISRVEAEDYLFDQPSGAFLIRVSERVHGYALSFRHGSRIRHYKLGTSASGKYEVIFYRLKSVVRRHLCFVGS